MTKKEELIYTRGTMQGISDVRQKYLEYFKHNTHPKDENGDQVYKYIYGITLESITTDLYNGANVRKQQLIYEIREEIARTNTKVKNTKPSKYKSLNINNKIRFRINPEYTEEICNYWSEKYGRKETLQSLFGIADQDDFRTCQAWVFIKHIGPFISKGSNPPVETSVYFLSDELCDCDINPPSVKQLDFIRAICKVLDITEPTGLSRSEARSWISDHISDYNKQLEYLSSFENYDWSMPNGD